MVELYIKYIHLVQKYELSLSNYYDYKLEPN